MPPKLNSFLRKRQKNFFKSSFSFKVKQKNNTICRLQEKKIIRIVNKDIIFDEIRRWTQFNNVKDSIKFQEGLSNSYLLSKTGAIGFWKRKKKFGPFLDLCVSSLRRGHANLLCIVPILSDVPEGTSLPASFLLIKT